MRIECDKCAAKYSIADEKVRGKTFKIRCKKCSNVIIVRDKAGGAEDAAASESPAADEPAGWHLAIDGETVGPLSEDEVRRRYDAGQIDKSTSAWQEGFEDWIELGQIEAFADLPDRAASSGGRAAAGLGLGLGAAADDPFASSGSDSAFAAGSGSNFDAPSSSFGGQAEAAPSHSAPAAQSGGHASPKVDSLTGQRNENSVLFSLDSLKAMASSQKPASAGPVRQAPSTTAPSSEGSGLIDIRAMSAMMDTPAATGGGGGSADEDLLPTFGGGGLGGLSVEPLVVEPPPTAAPAPAEPQRSNAPMYILIGLLAAGLIGLGVMFVMNQDKDPQVIEKVVQVPGAVQEKDDEEKEEDDKEKEEDDKKEDGKEEEAAAETGGEEGEPELDSSGKPTGKKTVKKPSSSTSGGSSSGGSTSGGSTSGGSSSGGSTSGGSKPAEPDVDCLLDPNLPKCKGGSSKSGGESKPAADPSLPAKLGTAEIKKGIDGVKAAAKACGSKNGAAAGTKVGIKFSVTGSTGSVASATATGEHAGTALGKCVEAEAKKAKFPKFQAEQQGFQFNFSM